MINQRSSIPHRRILCALFSLSLLTTPVVKLSAEDSENGSSRGIQSVYGEQSRYFPYQNGVLRKLSDSTGEGSMYYEFDALGFATTVLGPRPLGTPAQNTRYRARAYLRGAKTADVSTDQSDVRNQERRHFALPGMSKDLVSTRPFVSLDLRFSDLIKGVPLPHLVYPYPREGTQNGVGDDGKNMGRFLFVDEHSQPLADGTYQGGLLNGAGAILDKSGEPTSRFALMNGIFVGGYSTKSRGLAGITTENLTESGTYVDGVFDGVVEVRAESGWLVFSANFSSGILEDEVAVYYPNGTKRESCFFKGGIEEGRCVVKNQDGKLVEEVTFVKGLMSGERVSYHLTGKIKSKSQYDASGVLSGKVEEFDSAGQLVKVANYRQGVLNGEFAKFLGNGVVYKENYKDGKREGERTDFYPSGKTRAVRKYQRDLLHGELRSYFESGELRAKGLFAYGKIVGNIEVYNQKGVVIQRIAQIGRESELDMLTEKAAKE